VHTSIKARMSSAGHVMTSYFCYDDAC